MQLIYFQWSEKMTGQKTQNRNLSISNLKNSNAIRPTEDGVLFDLEITAGAVKPGFVGYNPWRQRLMIKVRAPARKGKANIELLQLLSNIFGVNFKNLKIIKGEHSTLKTIAIEGLGLDHAMEKIYEALNE